MKQGYMSNPATAGRGVKVITGTGGCGIPGLMAATAAEAAMWLWLPTVAFRRFWTLNINSIIAPLKAVMPAVREKAVKKAPIVLFVCRSGRSLGTTGRVC